MKILTGLPCAALALAASLGLACTAQAQEFPNRPVTLIVGYTAGGAIDQSARLVANELTKRWGQPVVVENRLGANGSIAAAAVAVAKPDGYTLLVTATSHTLNKFVNKNLRYDVEKSFAPVALTVEVPNVLVVNASSPYQTLGQLVTALREKQKPFSYGSQGVGGIPHLAGELFKLRTGTDMLHVPYKGASQVVTDLLGGVIDMSFPSHGSVLPFVQQGRLRALAIASTERSPQLKDVPTFAEAGVPNYLISTWHGMLAPAGTPAAVVTKINADVNAIIQMPEFRAALAAQGNSPAVPVSPAQFAAKMSNDLKSFEAVASRVDLSAN